MLAIIVWLAYVALDFIDVKFANNTKNYQMVATNGSFPIVDLDPQSFIIAVHLKEMEKSKFDVPLHEDVLDYWNVMF